MVKDAYGTLVANHNFHDVETMVRDGGRLTDPGRGGPPQGGLLAPVHGAQALAGDLRHTGLHLDEDDHPALEQDEVELVPSVPPVAGQDARAPGPAGVSGQTLTLGAKAFLGTAETHQAKQTTEHAAGWPAARRRVERPPRGFLT